MTTLSFSLFLTKELDQKSAINAQQQCVKDKKRARLYAKSKIMLGDFDFENTLCDLTRPKLDHMS